MPSHRTDFAGQSQGQSRPRRALVHVSVVTAVTLLRLLHWSWRKDITQLARLDALSRSDTPVIAAFWHGSYVPLFTLCSGRQALVLIAEGFRGDVIAGICRAFGYRPVHVGRSAERPVRKILSSAFASDAFIAAVAVDGPLGPRHEPKRATLRLARDLGLVIVPTRINARPRLVLWHRWDHMQVPLPFAKVTLSVGEPICIPADATIADLNTAEIGLIRALKGGSHGKDGLRAA